MNVIKCDKCGKETKNPIKDEFCRLLVTKGMKWIHLGKGNHHTHHHLCKNCKKKLFKNG